MSQTLVKLFVFLYLFIMAVKDRDKAIFAQKAIFCFVNNTFLVV